MMKTIPASQQKEATKNNAVDTGLSESVVNPDLFSYVCKRFPQSPHCATLGMEYVGIEGRKPTSKVTWKEALASHLATGILHGGVITSLVDTTSAFAVAAHFSELEIIATLDLRIDYLKSATPGQDVFCTAECYRLTRHVAFTRAICYHERPEDPIAHAVATFMRESMPTPAGISA